MNIVFLVAVFLLGVMAGIVHQNIAAKRRHVIQDEAWWFVG